MKTTTLCDPPSCSPTLYAPRVSTVLSALPKIQLSRLVGRPDFLPFNFAIDLGVVFTLQTGLELFTSRSLQRKIVYFYHVFFFCI